MLKFVLTVVQILLCFYLAGKMARQNPKIDVLLTHLENGYGSFNEKLKDAKVTGGLFVLRSFYGWLAICAILLFFILPKFIDPNPSVLRFLSLVGIAGSFGWFSIRWCIDHKKAVREIGSQASLMVFGPILLGVFDFLFHTPFTQILAEAFYSVPWPLLGWKVPHLTHPIAIGCAVSLLFAAGFVSYYIITWVLTVLATFASAIVVLLPVALACSIHALAPKKPFEGFALVLFGLVTLLLLWL